MEFVQPVFEIVKGIWKPIARRVGYAIKIENNFKELKERVLKLCHKRDDIKDRIGLVKLHKAPTRECKDWLTDVEEIENEVKKIEDEHLIEKRCFKGWLPDIVGRVKLGKQVVEMIERVKELQEKSKFEGGFVNDLPPAKVEEVCLPTLGAKTSVNRNLKKLVDYIKDGQNQRIGIWGMGGVGKTTLLKLLNNMPEIEEMFQIIVWVSVSRSWSIRNIQDQVANRLNIDIKNKSDVEVSRMLFLMLKSQKYLLLLDDVWEGLDLSELGIPNPNHENGCKIVLTSREFRVCREMGTNVDMKVETLSEEEAWEIFCTKVGEIATFPAINSIAKEIVRECGGLPLALNAVGGALAKVKDVHVWRNLLKKLKLPDMSYANHPSERVFESLKVSYNQIKDINMKNCFLYCGLYPEDHNINKYELISYWRAEGLLLGSSKGTLEDARDEGHQLLHDLTDASLLEEWEDDEKHVKMHDVVRDLVIKMTSPGGVDGEDCRHIVRAGSHCREETPVEEKEWEEATRISFMFNHKYDNFPKVPHCPKLTTLLLQNESLIWEPPFLTLPESFFNHMPMLCVLDLSYTGISSLPSSISNLVSLRALFLNKCFKLETLPSEVRALKSLEVLSLKGNKIQVMSIEIFELSSLRSLQFSHIGEGLGRTLPKLLDLILPNKAREISELCLLEEVSIVGRFIESDLIMEGIVEGLGRLPRLSTLEFNFVTVNNLQQFLNNSNSWKHQQLKEFCFFVGQDIPLGHNFFPNFMEGCKRRLHYRGIGDGSGNSIPLSVKEVLVCSDFVGLYDLAKCEKLTSDLGPQNTHRLKYCVVRECRAVKNILDEDGLRAGAFPNLQCLQVAELRSLDSICDCLSPAVAAMQSSKSFTMLRVLSVINCVNVKRLFCWGIVSQLVNLRYLEAGCCWQMEEMVSGDPGDGFNYSLPKLKIMRLYSMTELVGFSKGNPSLCFPLLEEVCFESCDKLKVFPLSIHDAPNLRRIKGEPGWWEALEWKDDATKLRFMPLFSEWKDFYITMGTFAIL